ncbi:MAG: protein phosphatase 2C domain-containing protein [Alphaproteobacteria bacterium]|nr:protein phosphatase 2C domain-containing protein [Alphaproteobacteria bacterium]
MSPPPHALARALTRRGSTHAVNDDRYALLDGRHAVVRDADRGVLYAVADGVSSTGEGYIAAELTCECLSEFFTTARPPSEELLLDLVENADAQVRLTSESACTLAGVWIAGPRAWVFCVGDSVVLRFRRGKLARMTPGQTRGRGLAAYIGMGSNVRPTVYLERIGVSDGDVFMLMTDGVLGCVSEGQLAEAFDLHPDPEAVLEYVQSELARIGNDDDATLIMVQVGDPDAFPLMGRRDRRNG